ncbi:MAG: DnaJ domain-containing protein [Candidatus Riflebacteria bacterium]|nr:DnaJ domain-containing protein [Candidatus Riflebacteria bacterium]
MEKDFYKVLGVSENATPEEIRKVYKELARKYHPDTNKSHGSEERFKEISEAYELLSNPEARREYDLKREASKFGRFNEGARWDRFGSPFSFESDMGGNGVEDLLSSFFGGRGNFSRKSNYTNWGQPTRNTRSANLKVPLKVACTGGRIHVSGIPGGSRSVEIPSDTTQGSIIKVSNPDGNFDLKIQIEDDPPFFLKDNNKIETVLQINLAQAILGSKIKLRDPRNSEIILTIPPGVQPGDLLKLKGQGLAGGDLLVRLEIIIPKNLSDDEKETFKLFAGKAGLKN